MEVWKIIEGSEKYLVSDFGNVKNLQNNKLLVKSIREGYNRVWLIDDNYKKQKSVHRLVCQAFLENKENKEQVNHINGIKDDNRLINLEWCTHSENMRHALDTKLKIPKKMTYKTRRAIIDANSKKVIDISNGFIYESISQASIELNFKKSTLIHYLLGTRKNKTSLRYLKN